MSSSAKVTLFRHAATDWSAVGRFAGKTDLPLSPAGEQSVSSYRERNGMPSFGHVLVSPLSRAVRTVELLGYENPVCDARLEERDYGEFEGLTTAQIREIRPGFVIWTDPIPGGETMGAFAGRVDSVVAELKQLQDGTVLVVAHAHLIRLFTARWLGLPPEGAALFRSDTLGRTVLGWERESPVLLAWNA